MAELEEALDLDAAGGKQVRPGGSRQHSKVELVHSDLWSRCEW